MSYSIVGIVNLALRRIGVKRIAALTEDTPQAIDANACWEYIRDLVLETKDWRFAKIRKKLAQGTVTPEYEWDYAYGLPEGFLRLCREDKDDPPVYPTGYAWKLETLSDGSLYFLTDYDNSGGDDLYITCIIRVVDPEQYSAHFIDCLAWRLAAELAIGRTESQSKFKWCMEMYGISLQQSEGLNRALDYLENESGNSDWEDAGR